MGLITLVFVWMQPLSGFVVKESFVIFLGLIANI